MNIVMKDWNLFWTASATVLLLVGMICTGATKYVKMAIHEELSGFMASLRKEFVSKEEFWKQFDRRKALRGADETRKR